MLFLGIFIGGLILLVVGVALKSSRGNVLESVGNLLAGFGVVAEVVLAIMLIVFLFSYSTSLNTVSDMQNFYERNQRIFSEAVVEFPDAATIKTSEGTSQEFKLSWDYTWNVLMYNKNLRWYQNYQDHWFYRLFVTRVSDDLDFIEL